MYTPKVSVIVPIYNVEPFIERCVRSLFEQTLAEIEYIFVNDCTPDASMEVLRRVLEDYPERKPWVHIIDMPKNSGLAKVRETGIKNSSGDYIIHCDSDDWVEVDMYRAMYEKAIKEDLDMVSCGMLYQDRYNTWHKREGSILENEDYISALLSHRITPSLQCRLIKSMIVKKNIEVLAQYSILNMHEDLVHILQYVLSMTCIGHIDMPYYHYCYNDQSICNMEESSEVSVRRFLMAEQNVRIIERILNVNGLLNSYEKELTDFKLRLRKAFMVVVIREPQHLSIWCRHFPELNSKYPFMSAEPLAYRVIFVLNLWHIYPYVYKKYAWFKKLFKCHD